VPKLTQVLLAAGLAGAAGCPNQIGTGPIHDDRGAYNRWAIETVNDGAVRNAIVAQHTLYPYHFMDGSADLNELGRRDISVLASHFRRYPGQVNLRKGAEDGVVYQARAKNVADALVAAGVAQGTVKVGDGMPGGDGMDASRVLVIMEADQNRLKGSGVSSGAPSPSGTPVNPSPTTSTGSRPATSTPMPANPGN
jgi:hypothetical protein